MQSLLVDGGRKLNGTVRISGSKNAVLPMLAATVLFKGPCCIRGCPRLTDVEAAIDILKDLGAEVEWHADEVMIDPRLIRRWEIPDALTRRMRGSVFFAGALMSRFGKCRLVQPGGCPLGKRPVDFHIAGLTALGARQISDDPSVYSGEMSGTEIVLPYPSVGATENMILAGVGASGETVIRNAAKEPEIECLCDFLRAGGCSISGDGTATIRVRAGLPACADMQVIPDRMEAATFACAAASAGGDVTMEDVYAVHVERVLWVLEHAGCRINRMDRAVRIRADRLISPGLIVTAPYPGFPTDAQAPMMAALLCAEGTAVIRETVFSDRMQHISAFNKMGAQVEQIGNSAYIHGVSGLRGCSVTAQDLRGGAAMVVAALAADGRSIIQGINHIQRGYEDFASKLRALGAEVWQA